jgi:hypothetical protein
MQAEVSVTSGFYKLGPPAPIAISSSILHKISASTSPTSPFSVITNYFSDPEDDESSTTSSDEKKVAAPAKKTGDGLTSSPCRGVQPGAIAIPLESLISSVRTEGQTEQGRCKNCRRGYFLSKQQQCSSSPSTQFCSGECLWSWRFSQQSGYDAR